MLSIRRVLGALAAFVVALVLTWAIWLVATPDTDGGRQAVGKFWLALVGSLVVVRIAFYIVARRRRRTPHQLL